MQLVIGRSFTNIIHIKKQLLKKFRMMSFMLLLHFYKLFLTFLQHKKYEFWETVFMFDNQWGKCHLVVISKEQNWIMNDIYVAFWKVRFQLWGGTQKKYNISRFSGKMYDSCFPILLYILIWMTIWNPPRKHGPNVNNRYFLRFHAGKIW